MRSTSRSKRLAAVLLAGSALATGIAWSIAAPRPALPDDPQQLQVLAGPAGQAAALARLRELAQAGAPGAQRALGEVLLFRGERDAAVEQLARAARGGDAQAGFMLGKTLLTGSATEPAHPLAGVAWLRAAADMGHPGAAYHLGIAYRNGYGVRADPALAAQWLARAAERGVAAAQFMLANAYREGQGVPRNEQEAVRLYTAAAEQDLPEASQALAMAYGRGELGLGVDPEQTNHYLREAAHALKHPALTP